MRKSNALLGYRYGERLQYAEVMTTKSLPGAVATFSALCALGAALVVPPVRWLLFALRLLPSPGEGPSKELMDTGFFKSARTQPARARHLLLGGRLSPA